MGRADVASATVGVSAGVVACVLLARVGCVGRASGLTRVWPDIAGACIPTRFVTPRIGDLLTRRAPSSPGPSVERPKPTPQPTHPFNLDA